MRIIPPDLPSIINSKHRKAEELIQKGAAIKIVCEEDFMGMD
jgi:hypothetical protein